MAIPTSQRQSVYALSQHTDMSIHQISKALDIPRSTIRNILDRGPTPDLEDGLQDPFTPETSQRVYDFVRHSPASRRKSWKTVATKLGLNCTRQTMNKQAKTQDLKRCKAVKKPWLTDKARTIRWNTGIEWQEKDQRHTIFSDESAMQNGRPKDVFVTRYPSEKFEEDCLCPTFRRLASTMVWGAIGYGFKSDLIFWDHKDWGKITGKGYLEHILPQVQRDYWTL